MEEYEGTRIDDRGRLKLPAPLSDYLELLPHEDENAEAITEADTAIDLSSGEWRLWSTEELFRSFDKETDDQNKV